MRRLKLPLLAVSPLVLTQKGCDLIGDSLAPVTHLRVAGFEHDSTIVDMAFDLVSRFGGTWITERRWHQVHPDASHTPDGVLRLSDGDNAIEVELTAVNKHRSGTPGYVRSQPADLVRELGRQPGSRSAPIWTPPRTNFLVLQQSIALI
jgi:hypothetical protein